MGNGVNNDRGIGSRTGRSLLQQSGGSFLPLFVEGNVTDVEEVFPESFFVEARVGKDERQLVTNPLMFPYNTVGKLFMDCPCREQKGECTATLIGPRMVMTAAHCIYDIAKCVNNPQCCLTPCSNFVFVPSYPLNTSSFSAVDANTPIGFMYGYLSGQTLTEYGQYDIGVIILGQDAAQNDLATLSYGFFGCKQDEADLLIAGYPQDLDEGENMYWSICSVELNTCGGESVFYHECDTERGMSGSSIWSVEGGTGVIIGVHSRATYRNGSQVNVGVSLNRQSTMYLQSIQGQILVNLTTNG